MTHFHNLRLRRIALALCAVAMAVTAAAPSARADVEQSLRSVVSILPIRSDSRPVQAGEGRGRVPEASGIIVGEGGLIATAWHVVKAVRAIQVRLHDGRVLPAELVGSDAATDIALLKVTAELPVFEPAPKPRLAQPVCAIGNAYGLDLSVTCGVVSAVNVSHAGFNAIEDFVQTDAAANPGSSGGALVDRSGRLVGMVSAIFANKADTNIGINFAVSTRLLFRVVDDLKDGGRVAYVKAGWRLTPLARQALSRGPGALIANVKARGPAGRAGLRAGDIIRKIGSRVIRGPKGALAALALVKPGDAVDVSFHRTGQRQQASLSFPSAGSQQANKAPSDNGKVQPATTADCPHPAAVCRVRQAVFPIESFDPIASAVRIAPDILVTNRHVVGARTTAKVMTPGGVLSAKVLPSSYTGDLALLAVEGLPKDGLVLTPSPGKAQKPPESSRFYAVGTDVARKEVRVFKPGQLILPPAQNAGLGRLHVSATMQPGVSGGALVDESGRLIGIAVGGGEGRNEAVPLLQVMLLLQGGKDDDAEHVQKQLGQAFETCANALDQTRGKRRGRRLEQSLIDALKTSCRASLNPGQILKAARILAFAREFDASISLARAAVDQVPNSINARISYLVSLQLAGRFKDMLAHARWLMEVQPRNPQALRFAIQSGVWGGDTDLAEAAYRRLEVADPRQAKAARRFIDRPPPLPRRR